MSSNEQNLKQNKIDELKFIYGKYKSGFVFNVLSVLCWVAFVVVYVLETVKGTLGLPYIIVGAICGVLLGTFSIYSIVRNIIKIKNLKKQIDILQN